MKNLKILVVEDDAILANDITEQLQAFGYVISDVVYNSDMAIQSFKKRIPDMVIMDIELKGSELDGIEIAEQFNKICRVPIVYLSSFYDSETRNKAKNTNPVNYLLKPWTPAQLEVAIDVAFANYFDQLSSGNSNFKSKEYFFIKNGARYVRYDEADIMWVQGGGYGSSIEIYTELERIIFSTSLHDFERQLSTNNLIRVHRSYLVNINHIQATERDRLILLRQKKEVYIPVSKDYPTIQQYLLKIRST